MLSRHLISWGLIQCRILKLQRILLSIVMDRYRTSLSEQPNQNDENFFLVSPDIGRISLQIFSTNNVQLSIHSVEAESRCRETYLTLHILYSLQSTKGPIKQIIKCQKSFCHGQGQEKKNAKIFQVLIGRRQKASLSCIRQYLQQHGAYYRTILRAITTYSVN